MPTNARELSGQSKDAGSDDEVQFRKIRCIARCDGEAMLIRRADAETKARAVKDVAPAPFVLDERTL
jgi:hypothetical protein